MLSTDGEYSQLGAASYLQSQLANIYAIQNMQDYLRFLIFTMTIFDAKSHNQHQIEALPRNELTLPIEASEDRVISPKSEVSSSYLDKEIQNTSSPSVSAFEASQKKSKRLRNLLAKRYSNQKIRFSAKANDVNETPEETYRNFNGIYLPIIKSRFKGIRKSITCGHVNRDHYARGLCASCYNLSGRDKKPWNCEHDKLYALGLCHRCYLLSKRRKVQPHKKETLISQSITAQQKSHEDVQIKQEF